MSIVKKGFMDLQFKTEEDFGNFNNSLKKRLEEREISRVDIPEFKRSAVMILIMNKGGKAHVFLTKRTDKVGTHKGHVSLPGGRFEREDENIMRTAIRETFEEVGIAPDDIDIIGQFDEFFSIGGFHVSTFVGSVDYPYQYKINEEEIEDCLEVPLSIFYDKEYDKIEHFQFRGEKMDVYYYYYNSFTIWGLTARILTDFADKVLKD